MAKVDVDDFIVRAIEDLGYRLVRIGSVGAGVPIASFCDSSARVSTYNSPTKIAFVCEELPPAYEPLTLAEIAQNWDREINHRGFPHRLKSISFVTGNACYANADNSNGANMCPQTLLECATFMDTGEPVGKLVPKKKVGE